MSRDDANSCLGQFPMGAFLVRCGRLGFALSLKTDCDVKHMKIECGNGDDEEIGTGRPTFYFSENRKFFSIVELVSWYCRNSLSESFQGLDTILHFPIGELSLVEAVYEFQPSAEDADVNTNTLPLQVGERLTVIDKLNEETGWFKAHNGKKIGYIPKTYVIELHRSP